MKRLEDATAQLWGCPLAHPAWIMNLWEGYPTWVTIPGAPHAKQRARTIRVGRGRSRTYAPDSAQEATIAWHLRLGSHSQAIEGPVAVYVRFWQPNARRWDIDNGLKALLDAGNQARLWLDDTQVKVILAFKDVDRENPRTELAFGPRRIDR